MFGKNKVTLFASRAPNVCTGNIDLLTVVSDSFASIMAIGNGLICGANILVWEFLKIMLVNYIIWIYCNKWANTHLLVQLCMFAERTVLII